MSAQSCSLSIRSSLSLSRSCFKSWQLISAHYALNRAISMVTLRILLILIACFSLATFVVLFGHVPALRRTPIGLLHRLIWNDVPSTIVRLDERVSGGRITRSLAASYDKMMNEKHPVVVVMYLTLLSGGIWIFLTRVSARLSSGHWFVIPAMICMPYTTLYLAASSDPGLITGQTHQADMEQYAFDNILFRRGKECATCRREKP